MTSATQRLLWVVRCYALNRQIWWVVGWMALMTLPAVAMMRGSPDPQRFGLLAVQLLAFPVGGCVFLMNAQARWQFCNPRARLTPHFVGPHLAILASLAVAFIGGIPLIMSAIGANFL